MKLPEKPWVLVRWSVVALIYAGTVAIAVDQVKTKDEKLRKATAKIDELRPAIAKIETTFGVMQKANQSQLEALEELQAEIPQRLAEAKLAGRLEVLQDNLKRLREVESAPATTARVAPAYQPVSRGYVPTPVALPDPIIPAWIPLADSVLNKQIKDKAVAAWKDDYSMVNHVIESQHKSYQEVLVYYKTGNTTIKGVINKAAQQWPGDYGMMAHVIKTQLEEKAKFEGRR